jgi:hypothetical protein
MIADFGKPAGYSSHNYQGSWVQFDFKEQKVSIEGYSVNSATTSSWPKIWEMEVSNDESSWVRIDARSTNGLSGSNVTKYFECKWIPAGFHRYVRLRQTGANADGTHCLAIGNLELFGRLQTPELSQ